MSSIDHDPNFDFNGEQESLKEPSLLEDDEQ